MLKIHTSDGQTIRIDLADEAQAREWLDRLKRDDFQATISGISMVETHETRTKCAECGAKASGDIGVQYSVSRPQQFNRVRYQVEHTKADGKAKGSERVIVFADDVRMTMTAHQSQPSSRIAMAKIGRQRFSGNR
jgi:hypothetical protein